MSKKRKLTLIAVVAITSAIVYWLFFSKPTSFPTDTVIAEINEMFPVAAAVKVQNTIFLDERHVFVPFISDKNRYGVSYWIWHRGGWKIARINTTGSPHLWKINKDPATHFIVWNLDPNDELKEIVFYLLKDRGFQVSHSYGLLNSGRQEFYTPKIQMQQKVSLEDQSYGVMPLPNDWVTVMKPHFKLMFAQQPDRLFLSMGIDAYNYFYVGWQPKTTFGENSFPERSVNGSGYQHLNINDEFIRILNDSDLEQK